MSRKPTEPENLLVMLFHDPSDTTKNALLSQIPADRRELILNSALMNIDEHLARVIRLRHDKGMSLGKIAKVIGKSYSTVWNYYSYGIFVTKAFILKNYCNHSMAAYDFSLN